MNMIGLDKWYKIEYEKLTVSLKVIHFNKKNR
jgi:hypothetical protein